MFCSKFISYPPKTSSLLISPLNTLHQFSDIRLDFSDISCFLSGQRDFWVHLIHVSRAWRQGKWINPLKAGECRVVAGLFLLHELLSHLCSCCWALAQGRTCSARALQAQLDEMLLQPSCAERNRERSFKKQTSQANRGWLHLCAKENGRNFPALLDHWPRVQPQIPANTRCSKVWSKAQGSRQELWLLILTCLIFFFLLLLLEA